MQQCSNYKVKKWGRNSKLSAKVSTLFRGLVPVSARGDHNLPLRSRKIFAGEICALFSWAFTTFPFQKNGIPNIEMEVSTRHAICQIQVAVGTGVTRASLLFWQQGSSVEQRLLCAARRLKHVPETRVRNTDKKQATRLEQGQGNMGVFHVSKFPGLLSWFLAGEFPTSFMFQFFLESSHARSDTPEIQKVVSHVKIC